jgi:hypothetical protein
VSTFVDLNGRVFRGTVNYNDGDLNADTRFRYFQSGKAVWGTIIGGNVAWGGLVASLTTDNSLAMQWFYVTPGGQIVSGTCRSVPEFLPDGRIRLHESWEINGTGERGHSQIEEIAG